MTTDSDAALAGLAETIEEFGAGLASFGRLKPPQALDGARLVSELKREWERANHRRLVPPVAPPDEKPPSEIPLLPPSEVLARWYKLGAGWLCDCSRLDVRAVVVAAKHPTVSAALLADAAFWPSLKARLRDRHADQVLNTAYFLADLAWISEAIRSRAALSPSEVPRWWVAPGPTTSQLASVVSRAAATNTFGEVLEQLGLPEALPEAFLASVARASQATQAAEVASLLMFLDRGRDMGNRAVIFESTRVWVHHAAQVGARFPRERLAIAELLRGRIGEVVAGRDDARWAGIEGERRIVRTWLIGEIFRVLFSHLVPDGPARHMTEPRRKFWSEYDQSVEKIWLLICDDHRDRLAGDEAVAKLRQHGLLEVLRFTGQAEQDGVWMQLRSSQGEPVTILEGNANMPIRIRVGAHSPPFAGEAYRSSARIVEYLHARSVFPEPYGSTSIAHRGDWPSRAANTLRELSVYPRSAR